MAPRALAGRRGFRVGFGMRVKGLGLRLSSAPFEEFGVAACVPELRLQGLA